MGTYESGTSRSSRLPQQREIDEALAAPPSQKDVEHVLKAAFGDQMTGENRIEIAGGGRVLVNAEQDYLYFTWERPSEPNSRIPQIDPMKQDKIICERSLDASWKPRDHQKVVRGAHIDSHEAEATFNNIVHVLMTTLGVKPEAVAAVEETQANAERAQLSKQLEELNGVSLPPRQS